jgi:hypothetical protein
MMMKICSIVALMLFFAAPLVAGELEILAPMVRETGQEQRPVYVYQTKSWEKRTIYKYAGFFMLKNSGAKPLTVITKSLSAGREYSDGKSPDKITLRILKSYSKEDHKSYSNEGQIIPSASDLALVEIRPNEIAEVKFEETDFSPLASAVIEYSIDDHFGGRFSYWVGRVKSPAFQVQKKDKDEKTQPSDAPDK